MPSLPPREQDKFCCLELLRRMAVASLVFSISNLGARLFCCLTQEPQVLSTEAAVSDFTNFCQTSATETVPLFNATPSIQASLHSPSLRDTVQWIHDVASWSTKCLGWSFFFFLKDWPNNLASQMICQATKQAPHPFPALQISQVSPVMKSHIDVHSCLPFFLLLFPSACLFTDCFLRLFFFNVSCCQQWRNWKFGQHWPSCHCFHKIYQQLGCNGPFSHFCYNNNNAVEESQMESNAI